MATFEISDLEINPDVLQAIIKGTQVGLTMTGIQPVAVGVSKYPSSPHQLGVLIGILGEYTGTLTLNMSERACLLMTGALLGEEQTEFSVDGIDAIGEVGNMVCGAYKDALEGSPMHFSGISCPTVVMGQSYEFYFATGFTTVNVTFEIPEIAVIHSTDRLMTVSVSVMKR